MGSFKLFNKKNEFRLISLYDNCPISRKISKILRIPLVRYELSRFGDKERKPTIYENLSGKNVCVIATASNDNDPDVILADTRRLIFTLATTCKVNSIILVEPVFFYQAQDKSHGRREPISAKLEANLLEESGKGHLKHVIVTELHAEQVEGFFDCSLDPLRVSPLFADYLLRYYPKEKFFVCAVDDGSCRIRDDVVKNLGKKISGIGSVDQLRARDKIDEKEFRSANLDVRGKIVVIYDDMLRSGGTLFQAAKALKEMGAKKVIGGVAHFFGFDSKDKSFIDKIHESGIDELVITNSRPLVVKKILENGWLKRKITILGISPYLAEAINRYKKGGTIKEMIKETRISKLYVVVNKAKG